MNRRNKAFRFFIRNAALWIALAVSLPLLFWNAFEHDYPMGYAGLFTQMARQVSDANFALPLESPHYGPGGIPFAYPPFGLYLFAVFIKLTGKYYFFLRWLPPIFTLFSIALTFILARRFFDHPHPAAMIAILAAASVDLYEAHAWSSGMVRAPAFIFAIVFICCYSPEPEKRTLRDVLLAGLFFGLAALSHLAYALFCFFWMFTASASLRNWKISLRDFVLAGLTALAVAGIWIVPVASRHGWDVFLAAFNSHGGGEALGASLDPPSLVRLFLFNLAPVLSNPLLAALLLIGLVYMLHDGYYRLPVFFLLVAWIFPENARFVYWLACFPAGYGLWRVSLRLYELTGRRVNLSQRALMSLICLPILAVLWWKGLSSISRLTPLLNPAALDLAEKSSQLFTAEGTYLALLIQDEAEWMPFLLQREPLVSQWGSEWLGEYDRQTWLMSRFQACRREKDWQCARSVLDDMDAAPQFIITYRAEKSLNEQIANDGQWRETYSNGRYVVWRSE